MLNTVSPGATVYVIEAKSATQKDVRTALQTAQNLGVQVVSMPFGAPEVASLNYGPPFAATPGMVWIAASGDSYEGPSFPATHPGVIAVGGTSAQLNTDNTLQSETALESASAGMSIVAAMPDFQMIPSVQKANTTAYRSVPDVAFNADYKNGALIYSSVIGGYVVVGGTSVAMAFFTGVVAIADASRKAKNKPLLTSIPGQGVLLQDSLYRLMSTNGGPTNSTVLNDVVGGHAGGVYPAGYPAGPGYDIATGLGSLKVQKFIEYMDTQ
ncbi:MAG: S8 family serine peptidase, partial [Rhodoferax sp.]